MYALKPGIRNWHWIHSMPAVWMIWELELETRANAKRYSGYCSTTSLNSDLLASVLRCIDDPTSLLPPRRSSPLSSYARAAADLQARDPRAAAAPLRRRGADPSQAAADGYQQADCATPMGGCPRLLAGVGPASPACCGCRPRQFTRSRLLVGIV